MLETLFVTRDGHLSAINQGPQRPVKHHQHTCGIFVQIPKIRRIRSQHANPPPLCQPILGCLATLTALSTERNHFVHIVDYHKKPHIIRSSLKRHHNSNVHCPTLTLHKQGGGTFALSETERTQLMKLVNKNKIFIVHP